MLRRRAVEYIAHASGGAIANASVATVKANKDESTSNQACAEMLEETRETCTTPSTDPPENLPSGQTNPDCNLPAVAAGAAAAVNGERDSLEARVATLEQRDSQREKEVTALRQEVEILRVELVRAISRG